jgi:hypothetical protein
MTMDMWVLLRDTAGAAIAGMIAAKAVDTAA